MGTKQFETQFNTFRWHLLQGTRDIEDWLRHYDTLKHEHKALSDYKQKHEAILGRLPSYIQNAFFTEKTGISKGKSDYLEIKLTELLDKLITADEKIEFLETELTNLKNEQSNKTS